MTAGDGAPVIWLNPIAALGLLALAAPVLIHVLARQRARRLPFPTLRFIGPRRFAALRRRALDDIHLLAVRALLLAAGAGAVAGPFLITEARRRQWNARTIRADVDGDPRAGLVRAVAWLATQPPGRREIVVRAPVRAGSLDASDIAAVPAHVGLRFEPAGMPSSPRSFPAAPAIVGGELVEREILLDGDRTSVVSRSAGPAPAVPVEIVAAADQRELADALLKSLEAAGIPSPLPNRAARVVFGEAGSTGDIRDAWMADAAARIAREAAPRADLRFGADGERLVVAAQRAAADPSAPALLRSVLNALGPLPARPDQEILPVPESRLRQWTRTPGEAAPPRPDTVVRDDRRWLWGTALFLLLVEAWLRRPRRAAPRARAEGSPAETSRVA